MAKAKVAARVITANEELAPVVDRGLQIDTEIKNLGFEDKAIKARICSSVAFNDGENTVDLEGTKAIATITKKMALEIEAPNSDFEEAFHKGEFAGAVTRIIEVTVPCTVTAEQVAKAVKALGGSIEVVYTAKAADIAGLPEDSRKKVAKVAKEKPSIAVKFEQKV
jgi:hypothetical protein